MTFLRAALVTLLAAILALTTAYGVGYAVRDSAPPPSTPRPVSTPAPQPVVAAQPIREIPVLLSEGDSGDAVRDLQARLVQIEWLHGDVTGSFDAATVEAVRGFQAKREIPVTGDIDRRTLDRLHAMTSTPTYEQKHNIEPEPGALDPRCTTGRALCIDKSTNSLGWVVDGQVLETFEVRFGVAEMPTREGEFSVYRMSRDHVSSIYGSSMPFAMFFSGGQAVHYSPEFAAEGYAGGSHGCVNVRDYDAIAALFDQVRIGDKVIVYWS
ncbi:MAG: L,D-transpeptidase family protein [Nocardioides sp.]